MDTNSHVLACSNVHVCSERLIPILWGIGRGGYHRYKIADASADSSAVLADESVLSVSIGGIGRCRYLPIFLPSKILNYFENSKMSVQLSNRTNWSDQGLRSKGCRCDGSSSIPESSLYCYSIYCLYDYMTIYSQ